MAEPITIEMLASVVSGYQFVLVDTNVITDPFIGSDSMGGIGDLIHAIHTLGDLRRHQTALDIYIQHWDRFAQEIVTAPHVYTTAAILNEISALQQHVERCLGFHQSLLDTELHRAQGRKYLPAHGRGKRLSNRAIERKRR